MADPDHYDSLVPEEREPEPDPEAPARAALDEMLSAERTGASVWNARFSPSAARVADVLLTRRPLRLLPGAAAQLSAILARSRSEEGKEKRRLEGIAAAIERSLGANGVLMAREWFRQAAGRIQLCKAEVQCVPKSVRWDVVPYDDGHVFVSGDFKAAHVAIAARWTGDWLLHQVVSDPKAYATLGEQYFSHMPPEERRDAAKIALLATLNGATVKAIHRVCHSKEAAKRFLDDVHAQCPGLARLYEWSAAQSAIATPGMIPVPSLKGGRWHHIQRTNRPGTLLSALWTITEAEALDCALTNLPRGSCLVAPMFDGILVSCPERDVQRVMRGLHDCMVDGAKVAGFETSVKVGSGSTWAEAEGLAKPG